MSKLGDQLSKHPFIVILGIVAAVVTIVFAPWEKVGDWYSAMRGGPEKIYLKKGVFFCWHGRKGYEILISYPEKWVRDGLDLNGLVDERPWDNVDDDLANDSVKYCNLDGDWFAASDPVWFPKGSHLKLDETGLTVCENSPGCFGASWQMKKGGDVPPYIENIYQPPRSKNNVEILGFTVSPQQ